MFSQSAPAVVNAAIAPAGCGVPQRAQVLRGHRWSRRCEGLVELARGQDGEPERAEGSAMNAP